MLFGKLDGSANILPKAGGESKTEIMTCVVGLEHGGKVYIGADSAGVAGSAAEVAHLDLTSGGKVFRRGRMVFGFTSSFRMGDILRYSFRVPHQTCKDDLRYLCTQFVDSLIDCFKKRGYARIEHNEVEGGTFLLGYRGKLYRVDRDFQVFKSLYPYDAVGSGHSYARGAMHAICDGWENRTSPADRIEGALRASQAFCADVREPFSIVSGE